MRIVHVSDAYLPRLGGIEVHVSDLAHRQAARGHEVHVVTTTNADAVGHERAASGVRLHRLPGGWARDFALGATHACRLVLGLEPDVVHAHNSVLSPLAVAVATRAARAGVPTAVTVHSLLPPVGPLLPMSGALLDLPATPIAWSAVSEVATRPLRRLLGPGREVSVLPNAVETAWWREAAVRRPRDHAGVVRLISVGRLAARKRPLALLSILAAARGRLDPATHLRLVLVGDGPQTDRIRRQARVLGVDDLLELPGRLDRVAIRTLLADSDAYVAPARLESFGIAALEARAVGLPVVAMASGGVGGFVRDGVEGLLVDGDATMVDALVALARPDGPREAMRAHNIAVAPGFGWDEALARTAALYGRAAALLPTRAIAPTGARLPATLRQPADAGVVA